MFVVVAKFGIVCIVIENRHLLFALVLMCVMSVSGVDVRVVHVVVCEISHFRFFRFVCAIL